MIRFTSETSTNIHRTDFYIQSQDLKWQIDGNLLAKMEANNKVSHFSISPTVHDQHVSDLSPIQEKLSTLEAAIADATENLGESETREALLKKAEFFAQV